MPKIFTAEEKYQKYIITGLKLGLKLPDFKVNLSSPVKEINSFAVVRKQGYRRKLLHGVCLDLAKS